MLRKGKNRPSMAVLVAEARTQQTIAKTFGRAVAVRRSACPFPSCRELPEPLFCSKHWQLLDSVMRGELLTELRAMQGRGQKTPSPKLRELFTLAIRDMRRELAAAVKPE